MEGNLKEIAAFLEGNFAEKREIGRKPYVPKVEALQLEDSLLTMSHFAAQTSHNASSDSLKISLGQAKLISDGAMMVPETTGCRGPPKSVKLSTPVKQP